MKVFGVTAPVTGSGKTSITLALLSGLKNATAFKIGPDYIDSGLSSALTGNRTWNIDRWIQGKAYLNAFARASSKYDYGVVEGVMGLFDSGSPIDLSTYYYFKKFRIPYIVVIDVSRLAESAYYIAKSFITKLTLGVIVNNYGSAKHLEIVSRPFREIGVKILGAIPANKDFRIPERHLGLHTGLEVESLDEIARKIASNIDFSFLDTVPDRKFVHQSMSENKASGKKIWIALDRAFNFYYADSLSALEGMGDLNYFSPLSGEKPEDADLVYLGGGYPELFPRELSSNHSLRNFMLDYSEAGGNVIAECGGLMYLEKAMETDSGTVDMTGIFQGTVKRNERLTIGYTQLRVLKDNTLFRRNEIVRGHEFHYSSIEDTGEKTMQNIIGRGIDGNDGLQIKNTFGSYSHFSIGRYSKRLARKLGIH